MNNSDSNRYSQRKSTLSTAEPAHPDESESDEEEEEEKADFEARLLGQFDQRDDADITDCDYVIWILFKMCVGSFIE